MSDLLRIAIETFGLNTRLEQYTRDLLKRGKDAAYRMNVPAVAKHYGLSERDVIDQRDLQFLPPPEGFPIWPEPKEPQ